MPKDRRTRSVSYERHSRASPFHCSSSTHHKHSSSSSQNATEPAAAAEDIKEWEDARCPVCMEHPHNAVLLLCSSHDKGCRVYMCDTSYRHSNCLDQFCKASSGSATIENIDDPQRSMKLSCPLCRGFVKGWTIVDPARVYMNAKARSCSLESCRYSGTYGELRKHARIEHPSVRPSDADPERERDWRRMERQRDFGDLLSTIQPFFGGEREFEATEDDYVSHVNAHSTHVIVFYVRVHRPGGSGAARSLPWMPSVSSRGSTRGRRRRSLTLWGESFEGELGSTGGIFSDSGRDEDDGASEEVLSIPSDHTRERSRRRRRMRIPDDEDLDLL